MTSELFGGHNCLRRMHLNPTALSSEYFYCGHFRVSLSFPHPPLQISSSYFFYPDSCCRCTQLQCLSRSHLVAICWLGKLRLLRINCTCAGKTQMRRGKKWFVGQGEKNVNFPLKLLQNFEQLNPKCLRSSTSKDF